MFVNENIENPSMYDPVSTSGHFHHIHGENITFSRNRTMAKCNGRFGHYNGLVFYHRPIRPFDEIRLEVLGWNRNDITQTLTVGITNKDPSNLTQNPLRSFVTDLLGADGWNGVLIPNRRMENDKTLDVLCQVRSHGAGITVRGKDGNLRYEDQIWENMGGNEDKWMFIYMRGRSLKVHIKNPTEMVALHHIFDIAFGVIMSLVRDWAFQALSNWMFSRRSIESSSSNTNTPATNTITATNAITTTTNAAITSATNSVITSTTTTTSTVSTIVPQAQAQPSLTQTQSTNEQTQREGTEEGSECIICLENQVNSCIVSCGHMCMCFPCAINYQRGSEAGRKNCPICRKRIDRIVQTFG